MSAFDDFYGNGSLDKLVDDLTTEGLGAPTIVETTGPDSAYLEIKWENSSVVLVHFTGGEVWRYTVFALTPPRQGLYTELSFAFCEAAIARGVGKFEAPGLTRDSRGALEASRWEFDKEGHATVAPEALRDWGEERQ